MDKATWTFLRFDMRHEAYKDINNDMQLCFLRFDMINHTYVYMYVHIPYVTFFSSFTCPWEGVESESGNCHDQLTLESAWRVIDDSGDRRPWRPRGQHARSLLIGWCRRMSVYMFQGAFSSLSYWAVGTWVGMKLYKHA